MDAEHPKEKDSGVTQFVALQLPDYCISHILTDCVAQLEGESDYFIKTFASNFKSEVRRLETRPFDLCRTSEAFLSTKDAKIRGPADYSIDLSRRALKIEEVLTKLQTTLDAQSDTFQS